VFWQTIFCDVAAEVPSTFGLADILLRAARGSRPGVHLSQDR
jgi:hypothetical protein